VTGPTANTDVLTDQLELSVQAVIKTYFIPTTRGVARLALISVALLVRIIRSVARKTTLIEFRLVDVSIALMATLATSLAVSAYQLKVGVTVVLETDLLPPGRLVAVAALAPMSTNMHVIEQMARNAVARGILVTGLPMTLVARNLGMGSS